jgi:preprotein translocase YajC subunit
MTAPPLTALLAAESAMGGLMPIYIVAMAAIVYFLIIRPQRQQQKEHDGVLTSLKKGDDVVLSSGLPAGSKCGC